MEKEGAELSGPERPCSSVGLHRPQTSLAERACLLINERHRGREGERERLRERTLSR